MIKQLTRKVTTNCRNLPKFTYRPFHNVVIKDDRSLFERRKAYKCGEKFVTLQQVLTYPEYAKLHNLPSNYPDSKYSCNQELNEKMSIWRGDITRLEIDAIVNAASNSLLGGGGIDGAIHKSAGPNLMQYNRSLGGCETGEAKISPGFNLPAEWVISTVGPIGESPKLLKACYVNCLKMLDEYGIKSVAFCGISTGIYGYPLDGAAHIAMKTVREWLEEHHKSVHRVIFVVFLDAEEQAYRDAAPYYFPTE